MTLESDGKLKTKNTFKLWWRIKDFVMPFFGLLILAISLNIAFSTFNAASIAMIRPIIQTIFPSEQVTQSNNIPSAESDWLSSMKDDFFHYVDSIIKGDSLESTLVNLSILIVLIFIFKNLFKYLGAVASAKLEEGTIKSIRDKVFAKITELSVDFFTKNKSGTIISVIANDVAAVNTTTIASFNVMLRELTSVIIFLIILLAVSVKLTLIAFSTSIISLILVKYGMQFLRRYAARMQNAMADYTSTLQETISGIRVIKAYNSEKTAANRFMNVTKQYVRSAVKLKKITTLIPAFNEIFAIVALCVVLYVGGTSVVAGEMSADDFFLFLFTLFGVMAPISIIVNTISNFQRGFVAAERVFAVLDQEPTVESGKIGIAKFNNMIEFKNIKFAYEDAPVVDDLSFSIEKGKKIAFVGPSGSGKSTALDLLIRFYEPQEGTIEIDGKDIKELDLVDYRSLFGIVSQETILFNDSIRNNIAFGKDFDDDKIKYASMISNAAKFIEDTKDGYDTVVGDRGITLSGGERQRVAIARALIRDPQILVFDEATSALDAESEKVVQEAIDNSLKNKTAVIVAHRLSTIVNCDKIYVFDRGKIVESGSHSELILHDGIYKMLYDIQFSEK